MPYGAGAGGFCAGEGVGPCDAGAERAGAAVAGQCGTLAASGLYQQRGWLSINQALANTDLNSGQLLHPAREPSESYLARDAIEQAAPAGMGSVASRRLGELELRLFLASVMRKERAWALAAAWRGDEVTLYRQADGLLAVRWTIGCDSAESAQLIVEATQDLLARWDRRGCPLLRGGSPTPLRSVHFSARCACCRSTAHCGNRRPGSGRTDRSGYCCCPN